VLHAVHIIIVVVNAVVIVNDKSRIVFSVLLLLKLTYSTLTSCYMRVWTWAPQAWAGGALVHPVIVAKCFLCCKCCLKS